MNVIDRPGDCVIKRLDDGRLSVLQADQIINVSVELLKSDLSEHVAWTGFLFAVDAVQGVLVYRYVERVTEFGNDYIRMEKVA